MSKYNTFDNEIKDITIIIEAHTIEDEILREVKIVHETPKPNIIKKTYKPNKFNWCCCYSSREDL